MLKERNNSILPPGYGSEVLLWATVLPLLMVEEEKKSILRGMGGRKTIDGDFLERVDVEGMASIGAGEQQTFVICACQAHL